MTRLAIAAVVAVMAAGTARGQQLSPADYYFAWLDAQAAQAEGRFQEAQALWTRLAEVTPDNATLWLRLAETRVALGRSAEALVAGARAYELGLPMPANRVAYRIADGYSGAGQVDSARAWLERALATRYSRRESIQRDNAFAALRAQPDFAAIAGIAPAGLTRDDGWRYDVAFLVMEIRRLRGHLGGRPLPQALFAAAEALNADIPHLTDDQIALGLFTSWPSSAMGTAGSRTPVPRQPKAPPSRSIRGSSRCSSGSSRTACTSSTPPKQNAGGSEVAWCGSVTCPSTRS